MEACGHEEGRAVNIATVLTIESKQGMGIFPTLHTGEKGAQDNRCKEAPFQSLTVVVKQGVMGPCYRCARG